MIGLEYVENCDTLCFELSVDKHKFHNHNKTWRLQLNCQVGQHLAVDVYNVKDACLSLFVVYVNIISYDYAIYCIKIYSNYLLDRDIFVIYWE